MNFARVAIFFVAAAWHVSSAGRPIFEIEMSGKASEMVSESSASFNSAASVLEKQ